MLGKLKAHVAVAESETREYKAEKVNEKDQNQEDNAKAVFLCPMKNAWKTLSSFKSGQTHTHKTQKDRKTPLL